MFILGSGCGWIPDPPIKFMYHIINLIKNLTPVILIIMGSLDFGKAVMSQKEDEIKKAQGAFIKKLIAGAAVFFVITFAGWMVKIIDNAGGNTGNAFNCVSLLLTGSYSADDINYYDGPEQKTTESTTYYNWKTTTIDYSTDSCWAQVQKISGYEGFSNYTTCKNIMINEHNNDELTASLFCDNLCKNNPYQPITTTLSPNDPDIWQDPNLSPWLKPGDSSIDGVIISDELQNQYENSACWNDIPQYAGFGACWSGVYYSNIQTNPLFTEADAKQLCMNLCNQHK